jgi:ABC-type microcin C transport system permease subunit YejB
MKLRRLGYARVFGKVRSQILFTRVRMKYKGMTFDCTNFFSLSSSNQDGYQNAPERDKPVILGTLFRSALFGRDQMVFDTFTVSERLYLASHWYKMSEKIVLNKEEDNIVY